MGAEPGSEGVWKVPGSGGSSLGLGPRALAGLGGVRARKW